MPLQTSSRLIKRAKRHSAFARMFQSADANMISVQRAGIEPSGQWHAVVQRAPYTFDEHTVDGSAIEIAEAKPQVESLSSEEFVAAVTNPAATPTRPTAMPQADVAYSVQRTVAPSSAIVPSTSTMHSLQTTVDTPAMPISSIAGTEQNVRTAPASASKQIVMATVSIGVNDVTIRSLTSSSPSTPNRERNQATSRPVSTLIHDSQPQATTTSQRMVDSSVPSPTLQHAEQSAATMQPAVGESSTDAEWRRLQRILQLHQKRQAGVQESTQTDAERQNNLPQAMESSGVAYQQLTSSQPVSASRAVTSAAVQRQNADDDSVAAREIPEISVGQPVSSRTTVAGESKTDAVKSGTASSKTQPPVVQSKAQDDSINTAQIISDNASNMLVGSSNTIVQPQKSTPPYHSMADVAPIQRGIEPGGQASQRDNVSAEETVPEEKTGHGATVRAIEEQPGQQFDTPNTSAELAASELEPMADIHSIPSLEQVWPIQRSIDSQQDLESSSDESGVTKEAVEEIVSPALPYDVVLSSEETTQLRTHMNTLPTVQPTESSVDVVLPRRPRPILKAPQQSFTNTDSAKSNTVQLVQQSDNQSMTGAVPTMVAHSVQPGGKQDEPIQDSLPDLGVSSNKGNAGTESSSLPGSPTQHQTEKPTMIETPIGTLPSDLWELIGDIPPQRIEQQTNSATNTKSDVIVRKFEDESQLERSSVESNQVQFQQYGQERANTFRLFDENSSPEERTKSKTTTPVQNLSGTVQKKTNESADPILMPQVTNPAINNDRGMQQTINGASTKQKTTTAPIDIEGLANQVYSHLKRRLVLERERLHLQ